MQLNHLKVENFRLFEQAEFAFDPRFNLVIGENGRGKTSLLRAIAVTLGGWALSYVDDLSGRRPIQESEAHVIYRDRRLLRARHVCIEARFSADVIGGDGVLKSGSVVDFEFHGSSGGLTGGLAAKVSVSGSEASSDFLAMDQRALVVEGARNNRDFTLPVIAFYECDRLWRWSTTAISSMWSRKTRHGAKVWTMPTWSRAGRLTVATSSAGTVRR